MSLRGNMDLLGEVVVHKTFGTGRITNFVSNYITILFNENNSEKEFVYPSAFGTFLVIKNDVLQNQIEAEKALLNQQVTNLNRIDWGTRSVVKPTVTKKSKAKPKKIAIVKSDDSTNL